MLVSAVAPFGVGSERAGDGTPHGLWGWMPVRPIAFLLTGALLFSACATPAGAPEAPPTRTSSPNAAQPAAPKAGGPTDARPSASTAPSPLASPPPVATSPPSLPSPFPTPPVEAKGAPATPRPTGTPPPPPTPAPTATAAPTATPTPTPTPVPTPPPPPGAVAMDIRGSAFVVEVEVGVGGTVTWTNRDVAPHTVTAAGGAWDSDFLVQGQSYSRTFSTAGTFPYACRVHPFMQGTVVVR